MPDVLRFEPTVTVLLVLMLVGIIGGADIRRRLDLADHRGARAAVLGWLLIGALLATGLSPVRDGGDFVNTTPLARLAGDPFALTNFALTIAVFVLAGLVVVGVRPVRPGLLLAAVLALTVAIELAQHYVVAGHSADVNDVLAAAIGLAGGYVAGVVVQWALDQLRDPRPAPELAALGA